MKRKEILGKDHADKVREATEFLKSKLEEAMKQQGGRQPVRYYKKLRKLKYKPKKKPTMWEQIKYLIKRVWELIYLKE